MSLNFFNRVTPRSEARVHVLPRSFMPLERKLGPLRNQIASKVIGCRPQTSGNKQNVTFPRAKVESVANQRTIVGNDQVVSRRDAVFFKVRRKPRGVLIYDLTVS
ncbi:hypothetical protein D3C87_1666560 [compost metagenome]